MRDRNWRSGEPTDLCWKGRCVGGAGTVGKKEAQKSEKGKSCFV